MSRRHLGRRIGALVLASILLLPIASWARGFDLPRAAKSGQGFAADPWASLWSLLAGLFSEPLAKNRGTIDPDGQPQESTSPTPPGQVDPDSGTENRGTIDPNG